jgi:hypothetical protein
VVLDGVDNNGVLEILTGQTVEIDGRMAMTQQSGVRHMTQSMALVYGPNGDICFDKNVSQSAGYVDVIQNETERCDEGRGDEFHPANMTKGIVTTEGSENYPVGTYVTVPFRLSIAAPKTLGEEYDAHLFFANGLVGEDGPVTNYVIKDGVRLELGDAPSSVLRCRKCEIRSNSIDFTVRAIRAQASADDGWQVGGDMNQDGRADLTDSIQFLGYLFLGNSEVPPCESADANVALLDWDNDGLSALNDTIASLKHVFLGDVAHGRGTECQRITGCPDACPANIRLLK